jgi:hypothetical protein
MKAADIIFQIQSVLPGLTNVFSTDIPLTSLTKGGATVTAVTPTAHGLTAGKYVYVANASRQTAITSITRAGTVATVVTTTDHDLTKHPTTAPWFPTVDLVGNSYAGFNGTFTLLSVPNRRTFTIKVPNTGPTTVGEDDTFGYLLEPWRYGFSGWQKILTVPTTTTFTYTTLDSFTGTAYGPSKVVRSPPRITAAASLERAQASYTKASANALWAFVVMGSVTAAKSKYTITDPVSSNNAGAVFRQSLMNAVHVYVFVPMQDDLSGRLGRDLMADVARYLIKSIVGKSYPTYFVDQTQSTLNFKQHRQLQYLNSYYIHEFEFEAVTDITTNDIVDPEFTRAFRDLNLHQLNDFDVEVLLTQINLDDEPL